MEEIGYIHCTERREDTERREGLYFPENVVYIHDIETAEYMEEMMEHKKYGYEAGLHLTYGLRMAEIYFKK